MVTVTERSKQHLRVGGKERTANDSPRNVSDNSESNWLSGSKKPQAGKAEGLWFVSVLVLLFSFKSCGLAVYAVFWLCPSQLMKR